MKKEMKWLIASIIYLAFGLFALPRILILAGVKLMPATVYFFICPLWISVGIIILLVLTKTKNYIIRGALIGLSAPLILLFLSAILGIYFNFLLFNGISGMFLGWLMYITLGVAVGYVIGKHKEDEKYFFFGK